MKTTTIETRKTLPMFKGAKPGTQEVEVTETNEYQGEQLGTGITDWRVVREERTDHIEEASKLALRFDFGWVPKNKIIALFYERAVGSPEAPTVRRVKFAR